MFAIVSTLDGILLKRFNEWFVKLFCRDNLSTKNLRFLAKRANVWNDFCFLPNFHSRAFITNVICFLFKCFVFKFISSCFCPCCEGRFKLALVRGKVWDRRTVAFRRLSLKKLALEIESIFRIFFLKNEELLNFKFKVFKSFILRSWLSELNVDSFLEITRESSQLTSWAVQNDVLLSKFVK